MPTDFLKDDAEAIKGKIRSKILKDPNWDLDKKYETDYSWKERELLKPSDVRTTAEMIAFLESAHGKDVGLDARVLAFREGKGGYRKLDRAGFREAYVAGNAMDDTRFRESFAGPGGGWGENGFSQTNPFGNTVGNDFTPLLGGPFYKQLYYYNDLLKMHQDCFFAAAHDPYAKATANIMMDFTLGKGYQVQCSNGAAQALWDAFEKANDFQAKMRKFAYELCVYGENIFWWLPNNQLFINFGDNATGSAFDPNKVTDPEDVPTGLIPRVRLVDPSNIVEIITHPEDIDRRIAYVWCTPTQYQIYTAKDPETGKVVNSSKFIYQQIAAEMMDHFTVNNVSNEKRGRSDLFAGLPYFKRLRDSINYAMINQQKNSAWCLDTTVEGDDADIQAYMDSQSELGTIPPAGSEFVHTKAIERKYNCNEGSTAGKSAEEVFEIGLSMIAAATGIPVSYFGSHLSSGSTRASAIVATEPVAKRFEMRQQVYKAVIEKCADRLFRHFKVKAEIDVYFSEIVTQDRSAKLKDLFLAEQSRWISPQRAATSAAKELGIDKYDYEKEMADIKAEQADEIPLPPGNPLTGGSPSGDSDSGPDSGSAVTGDEKKQVNDSRGF